MAPLARLYIFFRRLIRPTAPWDARVGDRDFVALCPRPGAIRERVPTAKMK
jgi:hypothetical protein